MADDEVLAQLSALVEQERLTLAAILQHLAEVERRGLHLAKGYSSLFAYCVQRLRFSEDVAYKRVGASRYGRRFPLVLEFIGAGTLHLSALMLIGPHLTETNHRDWLSAAAGKSKREVELLVAKRCPKPDVPSSIRKLPKHRELVSANDSGEPSISLRIAGLAAGAASCGIDAHAATPDSALRRFSDSTTATSCASSVVTTRDHSSNADTGTNPSLGTRSSSAAVTRDCSSSAATGTKLSSSAATGTKLSSSAATGTSSICYEKRLSGDSSKASERPRVQPLSSSSYRIVFTATEVFKQKLERAQELCSHSVAPGDLPLLLERALDRLIQQEQKRRCAIVSPETQAGAAVDSPIDGAVGESATTSPAIDRGHGRVRTDGAPDGLAVVNTPSKVKGDTRRKWQDPDPVELSQVELQPHRSDARTVAEAPLQVAVSKPCARSPDFSAVHELSRHVPAAVRRAVWERDGGQCAFVDEEGHRCTERRFLEIDHVVAFACGGAATTANCRLLCRAHNQHWARLTFGVDCLDRARSRRQAV